MPRRHKFEESKEMLSMREQARKRVRRTIYNDDGFGPFCSSEGGTPTGFLYGSKSRMSAVLDTLVDSVFICSAATHVLNHPSAVAETYADIVDKYIEGPKLFRPYYGDWQNIKNNMRALFAAGTDPIKLTQEFCREHDIECFYTYRVNDGHNAYIPEERSTWFREHPEYWMGSGPDDCVKYPDTDPRWFWSQLDFEISEVREYLLSILRDVVNRYDLDGIEIDYMRTTLFFRTNLSGLPATREQLDILTDFQYQVRLMAAEVGAKRGRPMLVSVRLPVTVSRCKHVGIDIEHWLKEDLTDLMTGSDGKVNFTVPWKEMVELGHQYGVPVYPVIGTASENIEEWRAAASNAWSTGADGVYLMNHCPPKTTPQLTELGDIKKLATLDKLFAMRHNPRSYRSSYVDFLEYSAATDDPYSYGANFGVLPKSLLLPLAIDISGKEIYLTLPIGDDISEAANNDTLDSAKMKVKVSQGKALDYLGFRLNENALVPEDVNIQEGWVTFNPDPSFYKVGCNQVFVKYTGPPEAKRYCSCVQIERLEVHVKYK